MLADHGGALLLGTVLVAYGVPRTVLLAVGGHASDRWRPWTVMMTSDTVRAVAAAALAIAAGLGPARAAILVPIAVVLGAGEGLFLPGSFAIVPSLLPDEDLQSGNALASARQQPAGHDSSSGRHGGTLMMNSGMLGAVVDSHLQEIRDQAARHRARARNQASARQPARARQPGSRPAGRTDRRAGLRRRAGFALVAAGLRMLTTPSAEAGLGRGRRA